MPKVSIALGSLYFTLNRNYIQGIRDYMLRRSVQWDIGLHPTDFYKSFAFDQKQIPQIDGVIGFFRDGDAIPELIRHRTHVVNVTLPACELPFPFVTFNSDAVGIMAADHLMGNARSRMVYIGPDGPVCKIRRTAYARRIKSEMGRDVEIVIYASDDIKKAEALLDEAIFRPLQSHSERIAVFAYSDSYAFSLAQMAIHRGFSIPEQLAILGCDNDDRICEFSPISLSSIPLDGREVGFQAAKIMDDLLAGRQVPMETWVDPQAIVERSSTSTFSTNDPVVSNAISLIRQHFPSGMNVNDLAQMMSLSYRQLEKSFRSELGISPKSIINKMRVEKSKQLLSQDKLTNAQIAIACGFSNANIFEQAFKKLTGKQPKQFRLRPEQPRGQRQTP